MSKNVRVELKGLSGDFDAAIGPNGIPIHGEIFGFTFEGHPEERTDIFIFPNGPLSIRNGQLTRVTADAVYTLVNPSQDPPGLAGLKLSFGGRLIGRDGDVFGENFRTVTTFSPTPDGGRDTIVRVINGNQEIKLHSSWKSQHPHEKGRGCGGSERHEQQDHR